MADIKDVGQWIYDDLGVHTGNLRHVKLAYFAQAWSLVWTGAPLFDERIEAWPNGPVVRPLWVAEEHGRDEFGNIRGADVSRLDRREVDVLRAVVRFYDPMRTDAIKELSHDPAWEKAREGYGPKQPSRELLDTDLIVRHYSRMSVLAPDEVPVAPLGIDCGSERRAVDVLQVSRAQRQRWSVVHSRLASA